MNKQFNPKEWLNSTNNQPEPINSNTAAIQKAIPSIVNNQNSIEAYITLIEQSGTDITKNYADWRNIGFAIAEEYGESGRQYFHRISKFHSSYDSKDCDEQYSKCINAKGHETSI
jgi:hypothetical protein